MCSGGALRGGPTGDKGRRAGRRGLWKSEASEGSKWESDLPGHYGSVFVKVG